MVHAIIKQQYYNTIVCRDIGKTVELLKAMMNSMGKSATISVFVG